MEFNPNVPDFDEDDGLGPPPANNPVLRRDEFIDIGQQRYRMENGVNGSQIVTVNDIPYTVQLDSNNNKFIDINGTIYRALQQPQGPLVAAMAANQGGRRRSRRRKSKRSRKSRRSRRV